MRHATPLFLFVSVLSLGCQGKVSGKPVPQRPIKGEIDKVNNRKATIDRKAAPGEPAPPGKTRPARVFSRLDYDLRANLPLAHVQHGGVVADPASYGFVKYLRDLKREWKIGARSDDDRPVAYPPGRQAQLWLPAGPELSGKPLSVEVLFRPVGRQRLALYVNGKVVAQPELSGGWQRVRADLPGGLVKRPGSVHVRLLFRRGRPHAGTRTAAALRYVRLGPKESPPLPEQEAALSKVLARAASEELVLPDGGGLDYYITPVKGLRLRGEARAGEVAVSAQVDGAAPRQLALSARLDLPLDAYAGRAVRLMLRGRGAARLAGAGLSGARPGPALEIKKPRYVVFWLIDALRADKLDFYGRRGNDKPPVKTPHLSALAAEGVVFDPFVVPSNESKAGHASYWTGTYPDIHRVLHWRDKLRESHLTIAELFRDAGYSTAAFVSNGFISRRWNYHQGFQRLVNFIREEKPNSAEAVVNAAIPWINRHRDGPFYLYLGTSDTHVTYRVHRRFIKDYDKGPYRGPYRRYVSGKSLGKIKQRKRPPPPRERDRIEAVYDNEAAFNDHHFGRLVAHLKKIGIHDQTLYIVNSDHGEEFWEHGSCGHGHNLHRELVSVPFVLRFPGVIPAGRVTTGHDGVDLLPTLMALMGVKPPDEVQGESLLPYVGASGGYPGAMVASDAAWSYALEVGHAKVIVRSRVAIDVYDLARDPVEKRDLYRTHPVLTHAALDPLSVFVGRAGRWRKRAWGRPNNLTRGFPDG